MPQKIIIHNPGSGSGDHGETVRRRADELGYTLEQTETAGDAVTLAAEAAEAGFSTVVAAGGDGTVNEVVQGIDRAGAFDDVELGILPLGTGNNFAEQIGIPDLDSAFVVLENGDRRRIDLGYASDRPFVNSCVAGLTAGGAMSDRYRYSLIYLALADSFRRSSPPIRGINLGRIPRRPPICGCVPRRWLATGRIRSLQLRAQL